MKGIKTMNTRPTPETDANLAGWIYYDIYYCHDSLSDNPLPWPEFARKLERERDEAYKIIFKMEGGAREMGYELYVMKQERDEARYALSKISLYLSVGMGDESTTAKQYYERILDGIGMLTTPIMQMLDQSRIERDEARAEIATVTAQRDRLAEALESVINADGTPMSIDRANKTLQSLTPNSQDR